VCCCCSRILYQEIDYTLEGRNADKFRENFANLDWVKVRNPAVELEVAPAMCPAMMNAPYLCACNSTMGKA
jgi:hypothetical protein